jgi:hypothetical protein
MGRKQITSLLAWAGGTFGLALAMGLPATTNAVDDSNSPALVATILTPSVTSSGIQLSVSQDIPATQPSDKSALKLTVRAVNTLDTPSTGDFQIQLESVVPGDLRSRVMPAPMVVWKDSGSIVLKGGETKTFSFTPSSVPDQKILLVDVGFGGQSVLMMSLAPQSGGQYAEAR